MTKSKVKEKLYKKKSNRILMTVVHAEQKD